MVNVSAKVKKDGVILTVANTDIGDAQTNYTYIDLDNCRHLSIQFVVEATTLTLEASNDRDSTANASKTWVDVTSALTGAANATATGMWIIDTAMAVGKLRIKRLTTNATNALKILVAKSF